MSLFLGEPHSFPSHFDGLVTLASNLDLTKALVISRFGGSENRTVQNQILENVAKGFKKKRPSFRVGDKVTVHVRLKEGDKERIQPFNGVVLFKTPNSGKGIHATFTVRKISEGVGVERTFPIHSPSVEKIEVHSSSEIRRARLYYLRELKGKKARLKEKEYFPDLVVEEPEPEVPAENPEEVSAAADSTSEAKAEAKKEEQPKAESSTAPEDKK